LPKCFDIDTILASWQSVAIIAMNNFAPSSSPAPVAKEDLATLFNEVHALSTRLKQAPSSEGDLLAAGCGILRILQTRGAQSVPQIARTRLTSRQNIQISVNRLQAQGFVELRPNPAHKRSALVFLTEKGKASLTKAQNEEERALAETTQHLQSAKVISAIGLLREIRQLIGVERAKVQRSSTARQHPVPAPYSEPVQSDESELPINLL
jgi:DNA-binding MarR family transcriptional regulator